MEEETRKTIDPALWYSNVFNSYAQKTDLHEMRHFWNVSLVQQHGPYNIHNFSKKFT